MKDTFPEFARLNSISTRRTSSGQTVPTYADCETEVHPPDDRPVKTELPSGSPPHRGGTGDEAKEDGSGGGDVPLVDTGVGPSQGQNQGESPEPQVPRPRSAEEKPPVRDSSVEGGSEGEAAAGPKYRVTNSILAEIEAEINSNENGEVPLSDVDAALAEAELMAAEAEMHLKQAELELGEADRHFAPFNRADAGTQTDGEFHEEGRRAPIRPSVGKKSVATQYNYETDGRNDVPGFEGRRRPRRERVRLEASLRRKMAKARDDPLNKFAYESDPSG